MTSPYPSIPIPKVELQSLHQAVMLMRQTLQLLIVNASQSSETTLSLASQIFATTKSANAFSNFASGSLGGLNSQVAALQSDVSILTTDVATNAAHIVTNTADITTNTTNIATNTTNIATNTTNIATNTADIATNTADVLAILATIPSLLPKAGGTMTGDLIMKEPASTNKIVGQNVAGTVLWTIEIGNGSGLFAILDPSGTSLLSIDPATGLVHTLHPVVSP